MPKKPSGFSLKAELIITMTGRPSWDAEQIERLRLHVLGGGTAARAAVMFSVSMSAARTKARELGFPFPTLREDRARRATAMVRTDHSRQI